MIWAMAGEVESVSATSLRREVADAGLGKQGLRLFHVARGDLVFLAGEVRAGLHHAGGTGRQAVISALQNGSRRHRRIESPGARGCRCSNGLFMLMVSQA